MTRGSKSAPGAVIGSAPGAVVGDETNLGGRTSGPHQSNGVHSVAQANSRSGSAQVTLQHAADLLIHRLQLLEDRLQEQDAEVWAEFIQTAQGLATIAPMLAPDRRGHLLTTAEMAERLRVTPKTLLKRKARGELRPAFQRGKLIRWRGNEAP
jgi:hypothetical protein